jgi:hypothetical protein
MGGTMKNTGFVRVKFKHNGYEGGMRVDIADQYLRRGLIDIIETSTDPKKPTKKGDGTQRRIDNREEER